MVTIDEFDTEQRAAIQTERGGSTYYKTLVRSGYAPVNGLQMYYEIHGAVTAKPLITIHPFAGLANVFPQLTTHRQLIAVELQGHGRTADIDRPLSFEQEADDVAALVKHLRIEQADFFGESFGGITAMQMAVRHPELVRRVAIYASTLGKLEYDPKDLASFTPDDYSVQFQRENYERVAPDPTQWPALLNKTTRIEWKGFSPDELKAITAPVLIVAGDHDWLGPRLEQVLDMFRLIPNAQLAVIANAGHFVLNENPGRLLPTIATFLDEPISATPFATIESGFHPGETR